MARFRLKMLRERKNARNDFFFYFRHFTKVCFHSLFIYFFRRIFPFIFRWCKKCFRLFSTRIHFMRFAWVPRTLSAIDERKNAEEAFVRRYFSFGSAMFIVNGTNGWHHVCGSHDAPATTESVAKTLTGDTPKLYRFSFYFLFFFDFFFFFVVFSLSFFVLFCEQRAMHCFRLNRFECLSSIVTFDAHDSQQTTGTHLCCSLELGTGEIVKERERKPLIKF